MRSERVACDAGPLLHLHEIGRTGCFSIFGKIFVPGPVIEEINDKTIIDCVRRKKRFEVFLVREKEKVSIEYAAIRYSLSIADSSVIQCTRAQGLTTVLTDDLGLREVARGRGLAPVGSIGILLRSCREKVLSKQETLSSLDDLLAKSSLFITPVLINKAKDAVREYRY
jgi:predicted nucleic acid-binding protein